MNTKMRLIQNSCKSKILICLMYATYFFEKLCVLVENSLCSEISIKLPLIYKAWAYSFIRGFRRAYNRKGLYLRRLVTGTEKAF